MVGVPASNGRKMQKSSDAINEYLKWQNRLNVARVDRLTKTERNALYRARGLRDGAARKAEVMADGTEEAKRILKNTEKYVEDGFASHGRKIQAAIKAYRDKNGKDSVTVEVEATIRLGYGSGLNKRHESRARVIVKDDLLSRFSMDETPGLIDLYNFMASFYKHQQTRERVKGGGKGTERPGRSWDFHQQNMQEIVPPICRNSSRSA
jgi:hypothetical protein